MRQLTSTGEQFRRGNAPVATKWVRRCDKTGSPLALRRNGCWGLDWRSKPALQGANRVYLALNGGTTGPSGWALRQNGCSEDATRIGGVSQL